MRMNNIHGKEVLEARVKGECFRRITLSFYRYVYFQNPEEFRNILYARLTALQGLGRIYLAEEGINAQMSVPAYHIPSLLRFLEDTEGLEKMRINVAIEDDGLSFSKLTIKVKKQIVADGLNRGDYDLSAVGTHLQADDFNRLMEDPDYVIVDMRNFYETEVGHFEGAIRPEVDTFRQQLPLVKEMLREKKEQPILLYCTGGIRCEKTSAYLRHYGFENVYQLHGGIIEYARRVKREGLDNKFHGSNFVFDDRLGEDISGEVISNCHQCGKPSARHRNCALEECHLLFIQCEECELVHNGCCGDLCTELMDESIEVRKARAHEVPGFHRHTFHSKPYSKEEPAQSG